MKKITFYLLLISINIVFFSTFLISSVNAVPAGQAFKDSLNKTAAGTGHTQNSFLNKENPADVIGFIIKGFLGLVGVFFLGLMIYGGYTWMLARGNETEVDKAKNTIQNAIIGLIVIFCAYALTAFFSNIIKPMS